MYGWEVKEHTGNVWRLTKLMQAEYRYLDEDDTWVATLILPNGGPNYHTAMSVKQNTFPDTTIYLKVFNQ